MASRHSISETVFVSGNAKKIEYFARLSGIQIESRSVDVEEIQSLDLEHIILSKAKAAYEILKVPVIVEDVSLEIAALNGLPGTLVKWFMQQLSLDEICALAGSHNRRAVARCAVAWWDGQEAKVFHGQLEGTIAHKPQGEEGYGWDRIFVPDGFDKTRAQMSREEDDLTYLTLKPFKAVGEFLRGS